LSKSETISYKNEHPVLNVLSLANLIYINWLWLYYS